MADMLLLPESPKYSLSFVDPPESTRSQTRPPCIKKTWLLQLKSVATCCNDPSKRNMKMIRAFRALRILRLLRLLKLQRLVNIAYDFISSYLIRNAKLWRDSFVCTETMTANTARSVFLAYLHNTSLMKVFVSVHPPFLDRWKYEIFKSRLDSAVSPW